MKAEQPNAAGPIEYAALATLMCGATLGTTAIHNGTLSMIALAVTLIGVFLLWSSKIWDTRDKVLGVALIPIGFWVIELIRLFERANSGGYFVLIDHALVIFIVATDILVSVATLGFLIWRLRVLTRAELPH